jgi:signal transduction histidine kinase
MSTKVITYIAIISIVLVLLMQAFLIWDYFQSVRVAITKESDVVLKEAFRKDLDMRNLILKNISEKELSEESIQKAGNEEVFIDMSQMAGKGEAGDEGLLNNFDMMMNSLISARVPLQINNLDSITATILNKRGIKSDFQIQLLDPKTLVVIKSSQGEMKTGFLEITSNIYPLDFENKQALRLVLLNPFSVVLKRMGLMLLGSIILTISSLWAIGFLINVLAKQKKLVAFKNEFLSNIAHELKRPVSSLIVNLDCLRMEEFFNNVKMRENVLNNSINSLTELNGAISMIVGLAKVQEGLLMLNKQPANITRIIQDLQNRFISSPSKKLTINADLGDEDVVITADSLMLTQCFANLIDNAIKYSGSVVEINISIKLNTNNVLVIFKDNGIGIPAEKIDKIFDKYSRVDNNTKVNGFGIGLNYVKTIIEKHQGKISVTSEPGVGSEFTVSLPRK